MYFTKPTPSIRQDYSISTESTDKRLTLRIDKDTSKCLELAYATAISSELYPFKDKASFLRWLIHDAYREIVERGNLRRPRVPILFGRHSNTI